MSLSRAIVIVGGGASGVLLAANLLRTRPETRVTLIETRQAMGAGVAYSTACPEHVLNVAASNMGAFPDDPGHFARWLADRGMLPAGDLQAFVPRRHYAGYLADVLGKASAGSQLTLVHGTAVDLRASSAGVEVILASGASVVGHAAVLATGHETRHLQGDDIAVTPGTASDTPLDPDAPVLIVGSGLSMADVWLTLASNGHRGPVTVLSRHGLLPQPHRPATKLEIDASEVPFGAPPRQLQRWLRRKVAVVLAQGGDWRSVADGLRPHNQRIWQSWSDAERRQFLEHVRPHWNIHRHRLPGEIHQRLTRAVREGGLRIEAGRLLGLERRDHGVRVTLRRRGEPQPSTLDVARVYDCGGLAADIGHSTNPLLQALVARGTARPDRRHIGLDVTADCEVLGRFGAISPRLYAVGPLTRGTFFEIEAIPDIRVQAARLAVRLTSAGEQRLDLALP